MPLRAPDGRNVERIGHRGAPRRFLENTLPSFREAFRLGADAVELDVHVTKDREVVVHHDSDLSGNALPAVLRRRQLGDLSMPEVLGVDLGDNARIPRLRDVLDLTSRSAVYVEVKAGDIGAVAEVVRSSPATCALHSFDHDAIVEARRIAPEIPRGVLLDSWPKSVAAIVERAGARDVWPRHSLLDAGRAAEIRALGCRIIAWTVNDRRRGLQLVELGVDGLCTDDLTLFESVP